MLTEKTIIGILGAVIKMLLIRGRKGVHYGGRYAAAEKNQRR